jgi:hypothetical protein
MHHRILGLSSTLAFLFASYAVAWLSDNDVSVVFSKPDAMKLNLEALLIASIFTFGVLFLIVWPQTLLASWIVRRFHPPRFFPFALFFVISSIVVGVFIFLDCLCGHWILKWLLLASYLFVPCSILWWISFRHRRVD